MENQVDVINEVEAIESMINASIAIRDILDTLPSNQQRLPILANLIHTYAEADGFTATEVFTRMAECAQFIESEGI